MRAPAIYRFLLLLIICSFLTASLPAQKRPTPRIPTAKKTPPAEIAPSTDLEKDVFPRAQIALKLAQLVYLLPDLDSKKTALLSRQYFSEFKQKMPAELSLAMAESDPNTGLRVAAFKPKSSLSRTHFLISIAGTEGFRDQIADISFGRSQCKHLLDLIDRLFEAHSLPQRPEIIITGHSLGGGLAQAVAWYLEKNLPDRKIKPNIWLFTWNAFGAKELIRKQDPAYDPKNAHLTYAANYFVQGEPVSKIGTHLGPTFELVPGEEVIQNLIVSFPKVGEEKISSVPFKKMDGVNKHRIETVVGLVGLDPKILIRAPQVQTERKFYTSLLTGVLDKTSGVTKYLPKLSFKLTAKGLPEVLADLYRKIGGLETPSREDREFFDWLEMTSERLFPNIEAQTKATFNELIELKDKALLQFYELKAVKVTKNKASIFQRILKKEFE